jgi:hypothetical protein
VRALSPRLVVILGVGALLAAGCTAQSSSPTVPEQVANTDAVQVTLTDTKHQGLLDFLKAQRGKVVVLDFWGEF